MSDLFVFLILIAAGLIALVWWGGTRWPTSRLATFVWVTLSLLIFAVAADGYLIDAFRVIDAGTVWLAAIPPLCLIAAAIIGVLVWNRKHSMHSGIRAFSLTLLALSFVGAEYLAAASVV